MIKNWHNTESKDNKFNNPVVDEFEQNVLSHLKVILLSYYFKIADYNTKNETFFHVKNLYCPGHTGQIWNSDQILPIFLKQNYQNWS